MKKKRQESCQKMFLTLSGERANKAPFLDYFKNSHMDTCQSSQCKGAERLHETQITLDVPLKLSYIIVVIRKETDQKVARELKGFKTKAMRLPTTDKMMFNLRSALVDSTYRHNGSMVAYLATDPKWACRDVRHGSSSTQERFVFNLKDVSLLFLQKSDGKLSAVNVKKDNPATIKVAGKRETVVEALKKIEISKIQIFFYS